MPPDGNYLASDEVRCTLLAAALRPVAVNGIDPCHKCAAAAAAVAAIFALGYLVATNAATKLPSPSPFFALIRDAATARIVPCIILSVTGS